MHFLWNKKTAVVLVFLLIINLIIFFKPQNFKSDQDTSLRNGNFNTVKGVRQKFSQTLQKLVEEKKGKEKEYYLLLQEWFQEQQNTNLNWGMALDDFHRLNIEDFSNIESIDDLNDQRDIVDSFLESTESFLGEFQEHGLEIVEKLEASLTQDDFAQNGLLKMEEYYNDLTPIVFQLCATYMEYAGQMLTIYDLLDEEWDMWEYVSETGDIRFEREQLDQEYMSLTNYISVLEAKLSILVQNYNASIIENMQNLL